MSKCRWLLPCCSSPPWWDSQLRRRRWVVGEVGIGIKADTPYRCEYGRLVEVER